MTDSLGSCFLAGVDVPITLVTNSGFAERIIFNVDVEVLKIGNDIHIYPFEKVTATHPMILLVNPYHQKRWIFTHNVVVHDHMRSMPCESGNG